MAVRRQDLDEGLEAVVLAFPVERARRRLAARRRVERRRKLVGGLAAGVAALLLSGAVSGGVAPGSRAGAPPAIVVQSGQSLWDIAARYAPEDTDPRAYIDELERLNHLEGTLRAGDRIKLPKKATFLASYP